MSYGMYECVCVWGGWVGLGVCVCVSKICCISPLIETVPHCNSCYTCLVSLFTYNSKEALFQCLKIVGKHESHF